MNFMHYVLYAFLTEGITMKKNSTHYTCYTFSKIFQALPQSDSTVLFDFYGECISCFIVLV